VQLVVFTFVVALLVSGCGESTCKAPDMLEYTCEPLSAGMPGCAGPIWEDDDGVIHEESPGVVFPDGCRAYLPECSGRRSSPREFECKVDPVPVWIEPV
jgi:hypothetical protein